MSLDYEKIRNWPIPSASQRYAPRDVMLYAVGLGLAQEAAENPTALRYVYESGLRVLPTLAVVLAPSPQWMRDPAAGLDGRRILHAEQRLRIHHPLLYNRIG